MTSTSTLRHQSRRVALATLTLTAAIALLVRLLGTSCELRELLGFAFDPPSHRAGDALDIASTNLRLIAAVLLAALAVRLRPQLRGVLDITLAAVFALNTAAAGIALGAYGSRLVEAVAIHAPLELGAFAAAGAAYLTSRAGELTASGFAAAAGMAVTLAAAGAALETSIEMRGGS